MEQRDRDYSRHVEKQGGEIVVFVIRQESKCGKCGAQLRDGSLLAIRQGVGLCIGCAGLADLAYLPAGDPAVTRRAGKYSARRAVVVRWARAGKRYERQGTLVEQAAMDRARAESAADAAVREVKNKKAAVKRELEDRAYLLAFTEKLTALFPRCPADEAAEITKHACEKYSGRVGRSAGAKELDEDKIRLAVIAHIRHVHTGYDAFFEIDVAKHDARRMVQGKIERVLAKWQGA